MQACAKNGCAVWAECAPGVPLNGWGHKGGAMAKLTNDLLKHARPECGKRLELRDDDEPGLIFRVTDSGKRSWSLRYRNAAGEHRRKSIGTYPSVTLSRAREEARKIKGAVASGSDVVGAERAHKAAEAGKRLHGLDALALEYFEAAEHGMHKPNARAAKRASTVKEERRIYDRFVAPVLARKPVPDIKRSDVQSMVTKIAKASAANARQALAVIRQLLAFAVWREVIDANPAHDIAVPAMKPRERVLTDDELKAFWAACETPQAVRGLGITRTMGMALQMAALTLQRRSEIVGMKWAEIDRSRRLWTIPASRMKGKRTHLVPLSDFALSILDQCEGQSEFVFATGRTDTHIEPGALSRAMNRMTEALEIENATPHDLRRTGATNLTSERLSFPRFIVSQVIGHAGDTGGAASVTGRHYDLNDYLAEKRKALDAWAELLSSLTA
jgi:integrase